MFMKVFKTLLITILLTSCYLGQTPNDSDNNKDVSVKDFILNISYWYSIEDNESLSGKTYYEYRFSSNQISLREKTNYSSLRVRYYANGSRISTDYISYKIIGRTLYIKDKDGKEHKLILAKRGNSIDLGDVMSNKKFNLRLFNRQQD